MLEIERAEGVYLYGPEGKRYTDLISGISVSNIGHCHPKVVQAVKDQAEKHMHLMVYGEMIQAPQVLLAEKLKSTLPPSLDHIYFVNSGSEAVEGALKLAKRYTGKTELISCINAYHGSTQGALSVMGNEYFKQSFRPLLPDVRHIRFNEIKDLEQITERTAAVIIEPIQGEAGIRIPDANYLSALRKKCTDTKTLLIFDEIQTGFGRTGKFWAFEQYQVTPDILVTAKGMGGGMPIGAFIASKEIMSALTNNPVLGHITTFGGHPVSCAASLATIHVLLEEGIIEQVKEKEALFLKRLKHPSIQSIRSAGLLIAVEFENYEVLKKIIDAAIEQGIVTDWFLFCDHAMRIAPPLTISTAQIEETCEKLLEILDGRL